MGGHIHIGVWFILSVALALPIIIVPARIIAGYLHDTPIGRAIAFVFP